MTTYAQIINDTITLTRGSLPASARRLDTNEWVIGLADAPVALQRACGWHQITDTTRPADDATITYDRSITIVAGTPTVTWTARPKTADEIASDAARTNRTTITTKATQALDTNRTFVALASPTNAQVVAQVKALSRQQNGVIRLLLNALDGTD